MSSERQAGLPRIPGSSANDSRLRSNPHDPEGASSMGGRRRSSSTDSVHRQPFRVGSLRTHGRRSATNLSAFETCNTTLLANLRLGLRAEFSNLFNLSGLRDEPMHELGTILRTCNEPWQPLVSWGFLRSIFRAKRSSALSFSCRCRPDARTKDTHFRRLSFPSARNVQPMVHCPLCYRRKGSHSWPLASCFRRTTLLRKSQGLQSRLIPYA